MTNKKNQHGKRNFHFLPKDVFSCQKTSYTSREIGSIGVPTVPTLYDGFQNFQAHGFQPISRPTFFSYKYGFKVHHKAEA